jgi:hypothetical protein
MSVHAIILALITLTGAPPESPDDPNYRPTTVIEDHFFCCDTVGTSGKSGEGCVKTTEELSDTCSAVLLCSGSWTRDDGTVHCAE